MLFKCFSLTIKAFYRIISMPKLLSSSLVIGNFSNYIWASDHLVQRLLKKKENCVFGDIEEHYEILTIYLPSSSNITTSLPKNIHFSFYFPIIGCDIREYYECCSIWPGMFIQSNKGWISYTTPSDPLHFCFEMCLECVGTPISVRQVTWNFLYVFLLEWLEA